MGQITMTGASGIGSMALGLSTGVKEVYSVVTTLGPLVDVTPLPEPRRVHRFGWYGLGYVAAGSDPSFVSWWKFQDFTADDPRDANGGLITFADTVFWAFGPGCVADITVYWP
jgi:hypothetical protein